MNTKYTIIGLILGIVCVYFLATTIADSRTSELVAFINNDVTSQELAIKETSQILGRGAASAEINEMIVDCNSTDSTQYDTLLSSLDKGLSRTNLTELKALFDRCGDRPSSRRSAMASKLGYQVIALETSVVILNKLESNEELNNRLQNWKALADKEKEIAMLFNQLVMAQDEIIKTLLGDVSPNVRSVEEIRVGAEEIRTKLTKATEEASLLRAKLK